MDHMFISDIESSSVILNKNIVKDSFIAAKLMSKQVEVERDGEVNPLI